MPQRLLNNNKQGIRYSIPLILEMDPQLWKLLSEQGRIIFSIKKWDVYRRAVEFSKDIPTSTEAAPNETS
jgi:hypothetical protein